MTLVTLIRLSLVTAIAIGVSASGAAAKDTLREVHFGSGQSSATESGALVRGDNDYWSFSAKGGQHADITVTSLEDNASFVLYQPPATVSHSDDGIDIDGTVMQGGDATNPPLDPGSQKHWAGALPATGTYYVWVGGDRGNATYELAVSIK
jgi:hypothetical protein